MSTASQKIASLKAVGMVECGVILLDETTGKRATVDRWGRVQWWENDGSGAMVSPSSSNPPPLSSNPTHD